MPISAPGPLTMLSTPGGTTSPITSASLRIDHGRRARRLDHRAVAGGERRRDLPRGHQQREVERDDLPDDAERLVEVVGDSVLSSISEIGPSSARISAGEVAEVVDRQRDVGGERLAHRLAVLLALGDREHLEVGLDRVGDRVRAPRARSAGERLAPGVLGGVRGVERELDVGGAPSTATSQNGSPVAGREVLAVLAGGRRRPTRRR